MTNGLINTEQNEWVTSTYRKSISHIHTTQTLTCADKNTHSRAHTQQRVSMGRSVWKLDCECVCVFFLTQHSRELSIFIMLQTSVLAAVSKIQIGYTARCLNWTMTKNHIQKWNETWKRVLGKIAVTVTRKSNLTVGTETSKQGAVSGVKVTPCYIERTFILNKKSQGKKVLHNFFRNNASTVRLSKLQFLDHGFLSRIH